MIHSLVINRKHIIEVGMTLGSDEQELIKALNNVTDSANADGAVVTDGSSPNPSDPNQAAPGTDNSPFPPLFPDPLNMNQVSPSDPTATPPTPAPIPPNNEALIGDNTAPNLSPYGIVSPTAPDTMTPSPIDTPAQGPVNPFDPIPVTPADLPEPVIPSDANAVSPVAPEVEVPAPVVDAVDTTPSESPSPEAETKTETETEPSTPSVDNSSSDDTNSDTNSVEKSDSTPSAEETGPLALIKKDVLVELRPLVDKLNISPEDKFDTLLLLIRSTDDSSLIEPAHEAAKAISDESRRAEALLEIVKEIDYLTKEK